MTLTAQWSPVHSDHQACLQISYCPACLQLTAKGLQPPLSLLEQAAESTAGCRPAQPLLPKPQSTHISGHATMSLILTARTAAQGAPLQESSQAELREPGGNTPPPELPELRSNCGTRRAKFAKLLAEQVGRPCRACGVTGSVLKCRMACIRGKPSDAG